jgi:hypothetical protein
MYTKFVPGIQEFEPADYEIVGSLREEVKEAAKFVRGDLRKSGSCIELAAIGSLCLPGSVPVMGSMYVSSITGESRYGYEYYPEHLEFHAWIEWKDCIVDFSLPEIIRIGLETCDDYGPFIIGRDPVILAGKPFDWMEYKKKETLEEFERRK